MEEIYVYKDDPLICYYLSKIQYICTDHAQIYSALDFFIFLPYSSFKMG
jgi:hypothetical protein